MSIVPPLYVVARISGRLRGIEASTFEQLEGHELVYARARATGEAPSCDGCSFSPDDWRHYQLWPACLIHDLHYEPDSPLGGDAAGRSEADRILRANLGALLRLQGAPRHLVHSLPWFYWSRVRVYGAGAYFYSMGRPESIWARLKDVYGR